MNRLWRQLLNAMPLLHRVSGMGIVCLALVHIIGHVINIRNFLRSYESEDEVTRKLAQFRNGSGNYLNPITDHAPYWKVYLTYLPGNKMKGNGDFAMEGLRYSGAPLVRTRH